MNNDIVQNHLYRGNNFFCYLDGLDDSPGALEAAASQLVCAVDGWQLHLPVPHHDGGDDAHETCPGHLQLQGR